MADTEEKTEFVRFTPEEIIFVSNVFRAQTVNPMAENALEIINRVQGIVRKMEFLKEESKQDGEQPS